MDGENKNSSGTNAGNKSRWPVGSVLSCYNDADFTTRLKAQFIYYLCLAAIGSILLITLYSAVLQLSNSRQASLFLPVLFPELALLAFFILSMLLLGRKRLALSAHLIVVATMAGTWLVMIVDNNDAVSRLDSVVFILAAMVMLPLTIVKHRITIFLYTVANILIMYVFVHFSYDQLHISWTAAADYLADTSIALIFIGIVGYNIFRINRAALEKAEEDIRERETAERALAKSEKRYRELFENAYESIFVIKDEIIIFGNPALSRMTGYEPEQIIGKSFLPYIHPLDRGEVQDRYTKRLRAEQMYSVYSIRIIDALNEIKWVEISAVQILWENAPAILVFMNDVTVRHKTEEELLQAKEKAEEMNRLKSSFLANMSHELRTPLIGILGYSELIKEMADNPELQRMAGVVFKSGSRLLETVNLILDLSKIESDAYEENHQYLNLAACLADTAELFRESAEKKNLFLKVLPFNGKLRVYSDQSIIEKILNNLINNAIKYTMQGGITLEPDQIEDEEGKWAVMRIIDTGIGITEDDQKIIWDEFRQASEGMGRHFEGAGLGLTLTRKYAQKIGGRIQISSQPGKGSVFTVLLPLKEPG